MDLLQQELNNNNSQQSVAKKKVLKALVVCIVLLIISIILLVILKGNQPVKEMFLLDGIEVTQKEELIIETQNGAKYISIQDGGELLGYKFFNGKYGSNEEDRNKCYLQNDNEIIGFEYETKVIYKIDRRKKEEQNPTYELKNAVEKNNQKLYVTLEDFSSACNVAILVSEDGKQIQIKTPKFLNEEYNVEINKEEKYKSFSEDFDNLKAVPRGMIVVNDGQNYGVIDIQGNTLVGAKYNEIKYNEYTGNFLAKRDNKYGIIKAEKGEAIIEIKYESIEILTYSPFLYKVKQNGKYGVIDEKGNEIIKAEYSGLGYNSGIKEESVLIIKNVTGTQNGMVVNKDGRYGIVNIKTGRTIVDCELERIYAKTLENDKVEYYVQLDGEEIELDEYIRLINTTVVTVPTEIPNQEEPEEQLPDEEPIEE